MTPAEAELYELRELIALQRFHARHGFGGLPPANIVALRRNRSYSPTTETHDMLVAEAIKIWQQLTRDFPDPADPARRKLARERGVHNVPKLLKLEGQ